MKHDSDEKMIFIILRNIFQLHHVHGGEQRGDHHHDPQLSSQEGAYSSHARVGEYMRNIENHLPANNEKMSYSNSNATLQASALILSKCERKYHFQVRVIFLQWIPFLLRMSRPGEKFSFKTIQIQNKMKEIDPPGSRSLLANVLDMDDDFKTSPTLPPASLHFSPQLGSNHHINKNGLFR